MDKKLEELENELKVLKNEVKGTLTDIREFLLTNVDNPFPVEFTQGMPPPRKGIERATVVPADGDGTTRASPQQVISGSGGAGGGQPVILGGQGERVILGSQGETGPQGETEAAAEHDSQSNPAKQKLSPKVSATDAVEKTEVPNAGQVSNNGSEGKAFLETFDQEASESEEPGNMDERVAPQNDRKNGSARQGDTPDLVTVAMLASWVEDGIHRVGRKRLEVIVEMYASMGRLSDQVKQMLHQLLSLDGSDGTVNKVPLSECVRALADLDNLLWQNQADRKASALLAGFLRGKVLYRAAD